MSDAVVVICTYNNAEMLDRALATVAEQDFDRSRWRCLVVDNNSTDRTAEVVDHHIATGRIPSLRCVAETKQGLAYARRRAFSETTEQIVAFIDDDCLLEKDWVSRLVGFYEVHPQCGVVGGYVQLQWETSPDDLLLKYADAYARQQLGDNTRLVGQTGYLVGAGLCIRRRAIEATGWLDHLTMVGRKGASLLAGEDTEIGFRIRNAGWELWYCPEMRLKHCVQKHRISQAYLCRLMTGMGRAAPVLALHQKDRARSLTLRNRAGIFWRCLKEVLPIWVRFNLARVFTRGCLTGERRVSYYYQTGRLAGAFRLLMRGC